MFKDEVNKICQHCILFPVVTTAKDSLMSSSSMALEGARSIVGNPTRNCMLDWLGDDLKGIGVWSLEHESGQKSWEPSLILEDAIPGIHNELIANHKLGERPLAVIGHSYGGLIIKKLLEHSYLNRSGIHSNCKLVVFLATPHMGSGWANFLTKVAAPLLSKTAEDLKRNNPSNSSLYYWYATQSESFGIATISFIEKQDAASTIVDRDSAFAGVGDRILMTVNHNDIAKPKAREDDPYKTIKIRLNKILEILQPISGLPLAARRSTPSQASTASGSAGEAHDAHLVIAVTPSLHQMALEMDKEGETFLIRHWLFHRNVVGDLDNGTSGRAPFLKECSDGRVKRDRLGKLFTELIKYADNDMMIRHDEEDLRLFVRILLPSEIISDDSISSLAPDWDCPVFWGCSSRYRVGGSDLEKIWVDSRRRLVKKWKIVDAKFAQGQKLGSLDWASFSSKLGGDDLTVQPDFSMMDFMDPSVLDDAGPIDQLAEKVAVFLATAGCLHQPSPAIHLQSNVGWKRWYRLIQSGIPLSLWCSADLEAREAMTTNDTGEESRCLETLMGWDKNTWLEKMCDYTARSLLRIMPALTPFTSARHFLCAGSRRF